MLLLRSYSDKISQGLRAGFKTRENMAKIAYGNEAAAGG